MNDPRVKRGSNIRAAIDQSIKQSNLETTKEPTKPLRRSSPIASQSGRSTANQSINQFFKQTGSTANKEPPKPYVYQSIKQMHNQSWQSINELVDNCHFVPVREPIPLHLYLEDQSAKPKTKDAINQSDYILPALQPGQSNNQSINLTQHDSSLACMPRDFDFNNQTDHQSINQRARATSPFAPISGFIDIPSSQPISQSTNQWSYQTSIPLVDQATQIDEIDQKLIYDFDRDFDTDLLDHLISRLIDHSLMEVRSEENVSSLEAEYDRLVKIQADRAHQLIEQEQKELAAYEEHIQSIKQLIQERKAAIEQARIQAENDRLERERVEAIEQAIQNQPDPVRLGVDQEFIPSVINLSISRSIDDKRRNKQAVDDFLAQLSMRM